MRNVMPAGNTFSDITEAIGLNAEAQTLAAGTIANGVTAQVYPLAWPLHEDIVASSLQVLEQDSGIRKWGL